MKTPRSIVLLGSVDRTHKHQDVVSIRDRKGKRIIQHAVFIRCIASAKAPLAAAGSVKLADGEKVLGVLPYPKRGKQPAEFNIPVLV